MKHVIIKAIRAYQAASKGIGATPLLFGTFSGCRSWPTCSEYAIGAIEHEGVLRGSLKAMLRVARCNPLWRLQYHG